jgi:hypothetical protein
MKLYIEPCEQYPLHELDITDWLAKENGFDPQLIEEIEIIKETEDAYCIERAGTYHNIQKWLPKSQCKIIVRTGPKK